MFLDACFLEKIGFYLSEISLVTAPDLPSKREVWQKKTVLKLSYRTILPHVKINNRSTRRNTISDIDRLVRAQFMVASLQSFIKSGEIFLETFDFFRILSQG